MLRVLTLSTLFPDASQPTLGVFVERQTLGLAALTDTEVEVVAAVGLPPWPLARLSHYAPRAALPREEDWKGLRVHRPRYRVWPRIGETGTAAAMARALLPVLRRIRTRFPFDVIDAEFFWPDGPAAMRLAAALGVPFSVKARGADISYWGERDGSREQIVAAAQAASGLLAVSAALKADMVRLGMPEDRIAMHHTGVDHDRFVPVDRAAAKARLGVSGPLIVTAGALIPRKNQSAALHALAALREATLLMVGDGPDRAKLEAEARNLGLTGRVHFLGRQPHDALPFLLGAADLMMLPSLSEGLANVWVEAMACGTPVVIGDVGGAREAVDRPEAGRIVALEPTALAAAAREILSKPPPQEAARSAALKFSWEANARTLRAHLAKCALDPGSRPS